MNLLEIPSSPAKKGCISGLPFCIILGMSDTTSLLHERVDDIPLLIGLMKDMQLDSILNQCLPTHGNHGGLDPGTMAMIWLAFILSHGDHRKVAVEPWVKSRPITLENLFGQPISDKDFTDDRLSILLKYLGDPTTWRETTFPFLLPLRFSEFLAGWSSITAWVIGLSRKWSALPARAMKQS